MKKINKKYLIYWVNIILLMLNTALLVFFCFTPEKTIYKNEASTISNEFLRKELDFTDEQYKLINELDSIVLRRHQTVLKLLSKTLSDVERTGKAQPFLGRAQQNSHVRGTFA